MRTPSQGALAFGAILTTCVAGILQLSWWTAVAGACVLALISLSNHPYAYRTVEGRESAQSTLFFASFLNAAATAGAALFVGRAIGWFWGVHL
jgi:hypothetical protein